MLMLPDKYFEIIFPNCFSKVEGSVAGEAVQGESVRVEDVWLVQPGEVGQGLQQIEQRGLQPHIVLSQQQQQFVQPLQDNTVSSTTPDL